MSFSFQWAYVLKVQIFISSYIYICRPHLGVGFRASLCGEY